jgi:hypothetical protein
MASLADIVFDCAHPASLARFWADALDGHAVAPYDEAELARLRGLGVFDPEDDPSVLVEAQAGHPRLWFPRVAEAKVVKNRVHIDLRCPYLDAEVARLVSPGASVLQDQPNPDLVIMQDPQGNEFCVFQHD